MPLWTWNREWEYPGEGVQTLMTKFQKANALSPDETCRYLYNCKASSLGYGQKHPRSLIRMSWARSNSEDLFSDFFINRSLEKICGNWSWHLANDKCTRICLSCLSEGHLPRYLQISGIKFCATHNEEIISHCPNCSAITASYAIEKNRIFEPFICSQCQQPYSREWLRQSEKLNWSCTSDFPKVARIENWLKTIGTGGWQWPDIDQWLPYSQASKGTPEREIAVLRVLAEIVPGLPLNCIAQNDQPKVAIYEASERNLRENERIALYLEFREKLIDWCVRLHSTTPCSYEECFEDFDGMPVPTEKQPPLHWYALHLWRSRFEEFRVSSPTDRIDSTVHLREVMLYWPGYLLVNKDAWLNFLLEAWNSDLNAARQWHLILDESQQLENSDRKNFLFEKYAPMRIFLCPILRPVSPQIALLIKDGDQGRSVAIVAGINPQEK